MKSIFISLCVVVACFLSSNEAHSQQPDPPPPDDEIAAQKAKDDAAAKKAAENEKINKKAIEEIDKKLKNLDKLKDADKVKALEAMKKYIQDHLKDDPATVLDKAAKEAKKAVSTGDKIKDAGSDSMVDELKSDLKKEIFGLVLKATGTGQTTGHIANLSVTNNSDIQLNIQPQIFYIPSDGKYQPYIGTIPERTTIPSGITVSIPVHGYCADVTTPPVPSGNTLPPIDTWVPVGDPAMPPYTPALTPSGAGTGEGTPIIVVDRDPVTPFTPSSIPGITSDPGFRPGSTPGTGIIITWPGTETPVGGIFTPGTKPTTIAPVLLGALTQIAKAFDELQGDNKNLTPFSPDPLREREAVIQQTLWIYAAALEGEKYEKENFTDKVYDQFQNSNGKSVVTLPPDQKDNIDSGITDFWNVFQATGVNAKVLSDTKPKGTTTAPIDPDQAIADPDEPPVLIRENAKQCHCGDISFDLLVWDTEPISGGGSQGIQANLFKGKHTIGSKAGLPEHEIKAGKKDLKKGDVQIVELKNLEIDCPCVEITEAIQDADKALAKLEKSNRTKLDKAKSDMVTKEAELTEENAKRRPNKITVDRLTGEIEKLKEKVIELETPITEKQKEIDDLKKASKTSDCPVSKESVTMNGKTITPTDTGGYSLYVTKGDGALECKIVISYSCQSDLCQAVQCSRTIVIKVDE